MLTDPTEDYARGFVPFLGVNVFLDSRPLIPRVETEYWTEQAIETLAGFQSLRNAPRFTVLDLFAGSGAIGLAVLKHVPTAWVTFGEKETRHFPTIEKSIKEGDMDRARATLVKTDVFNGISGTFDLVLANPPYISKERSTISPDVLTEEPHEALFADDDGFALIARTIAGLKHHLAPAGEMWIEHEPFHTKRIAETAREKGFLAEVLKDQYGVERVSRLRWNSGIL